MIFIISTVVDSSLQGFVTNQHEDQLPVGLLAHLVKCCTSIAKVMGSNPVQAWIFFRPYFHHCLSSAYYCEDHFHSRPQDSVKLLYDLLYIPEGGMGRVRVMCLTKNRTQLLGKRWNSNLFNKALSGYQFKFAFFVLCEVKNTLWKPRRISIAE